VHTAPKRHGQAHALGHQPCGMLVAAGLCEREAGIHSNPRGGLSRSARLWGLLGQDAAAVALDWAIWARMSSMSSARALAMTSSRAEAGSAPGWL
jgi:hypothetical protein